MLKRIVVIVLAATVLYSAFAVGPAVFVPMGGACEEGVVMDPCSQ